MARKRMFSLDIVDTDAFLDMPQSSQLLYFHLAMRADDEGFISSPKKIMKMIGSSEDDLKVLLAKRFVIGFESGVCVIKHWLIHNTIRMDRFGGTTYLRERAQLLIKDNKAYKLIEINENKELETTSGNHLATQYKLSKDNISKVNTGEEAKFTPSEEARLFFNTKEAQLKVVLFLEDKGIPKDAAEKEITKFISYWTELNKSGTKQRWEMEKTFEVQRRLTTWFSKVSQFQKSQKNIGVIKV